jgi:transcriptional regulator with XRE-family HTH domain
MQKIMNSSSIQNALSCQGLTQKSLAKMVGVSPQSVTNWLNGTNFPRPPVLLKLAATLKLTFDDMVVTETEGRPVIAFRKKGGSKTTTAHLSKANAMGMLLKPLVPYLPELQSLRVLITSPSTDYHKLQTAVSQTRQHLGIGQIAVLNYDHLISKFGESGAVVIPVLWGEKKHHRNAMHIRLPEEDVTFIFLNLDTREEDFKFWMAHELAHVYTPDLAGSDEGEDYADAFAGALLFPHACAEQVYREAIAESGESGVVQVMQSHARKHLISLNTVYQQTIQYAENAGLPPITILEKTVHGIRNSQQGQLVSAGLFDPMPPEPDRYVAACSGIFQSDFFEALKRMIHEKGVGPSYIQQIIDISLQDAYGLHKELSH